jgi:hypothetical protein
VDQPSDPSGRRRSSASGDRGQAPDETGAQPDESVADESSADAARQRLRALGIVAIEPDDRIGGLLAPGEAVVAVRRSVRLERRHSPREGDVSDPPDRPGLAGDLYVTTRRLVHLGRSRVDYRLSEIRDAVEAPGALRLIVRDERGIEITVGDPRVLRVEIAAVREAARRAGSVKT